MAIVQCELPKPKQETTVNQKESEEHLKSILKELGKVLREFDPEELELFLSTLPISMEHITSIIKEDIQCARETSTNNQPKEMEGRVTPSRRRGSQKRSISRRRRVYIADSKISVPVELA
jgi:hypothetical protein